jgi:hypothetical protein
VPTAADYYEFNFGFATGFIDKGHWSRYRVSSGWRTALAIYKPLSNQNLITWKDTPIYDAPAVGSAPFGTLANNLRYPIISKLKDRLNQTWFQIPHRQPAGVGQQPGCAKITASRTDLSPYSA